MDCFWCINDTTTNAQALEKLCSAEITVQLQYDMKKDLADCYDCISAYHSAKHLFLEDHQSAQKELLVWETERLCHHIKSVLNPKRESEDEDGDIGSLFQEDATQSFGFGDGVELKCKLSIPLQEILNFPYLLWNKELASLAVRGLLSLEEAGSPLILDGKLPGIYLLLIHPNGQVRKWARKSVNFLGSISCDDYDDLTDVVNWIMGVPEFGLFRCPNLGDDPSTQASYTILPSHLFVQQSVKEFWLGVCMFLKALETSTVRLQLVSRDNHQAFVGVVVNALDHTNSVDKKKVQGSDSEFWPVLHCFVILLERLGSRIWQHVTSSDVQMQVFRLITNHPAYQDELRHWPGFYHEETQSSSTSCDDLDDNGGNVSSSQMVYRWDGRRRRSSDLPRTRSNSLQSFTGKSKRQKVAFAWFQPYIKSVVDFGDICCAVVKVVLKYLHELKVEFQVSSEGYDNSIAALVICLDQLSKGSLRSMLTIASDLWIVDVMEVLALEMPQPSRGQKLAHAFCKSLLERMIKRGVNVTGLLKWIEDRNSLKKPDPQMLHRLRTLLQNYFKGEVTSPSATRIFDRERRMIVKSKVRRSDCEKPAKDGTSSEDWTSPPRIKEEFKFVMSSKSPSLDISKSPSHDISKTSLGISKSPPLDISESPSLDNSKKPKTIKKSEVALVSPKVVKGSQKKKEKKLFEYFQRSPMLQPKIDIEKLKVTRKDKDLLVVDDSDDFMLGSDKKGSNLGVVSPKLSTKVKKLTHKKSKRENGASSTDTLSTHATKMPTKTFYRNASVSEKTSKAGNSSCQKLDLPTLLGDEDDEFLDSICSQIETKLTPRTTNSEVADLKRTSDDQSSSKTKRMNSWNETSAVVKTEKDYIVISDDSSDEMDVSTETKFWEKEDRKPSVRDLRNSNQSSDGSWIVIDEVKKENDNDGDEFVLKNIKTEESGDFSKPEIKKEDNGDGEYVLEGIKTEIPSWDSFKKIVPEIKIELDSPYRSGPEIKEEKDSHSDQSSPDPVFCFNNDDDWDPTMNDGNDDVLMSCLDVRDSLDTMTCVEADLSELPEEAVADNDIKVNGSELDEVIFLSSDSEDMSRENEDCKPKRGGQAPNLLATITEDVATDSDNPRTNTEDRKTNAEELPTTSELVKNLREVEPRDVPSDRSSPELNKTKCFEAMISKLKSVVKRSSSTIVSQLQVTSKSDAVDPPRQITEVEKENDERGVDMVSENVVTNNDQQPNIVRDVGLSKDTQLAESVDQDEGYDTKSANKNIGIVRPLTHSRNPALVRSESCNAQPLERAPLTVKQNTVRSRSLGSDPRDAAASSVVSKKITQRRTSDAQIVTKPKNVVTVEAFYHAILKWDARLLYQTPIQSPHIPDGGKVCRTFKSMDHYYKIFMPLVFLEVWAQAAREWKEKLSKREHVEYSLTVDSVNHFVAHFQLIKCKKRFKSDGGLPTFSVQENDLVVIRISEDSGRTCTKVFAIVDSVSKETARWQPGDEGECAGQYVEFTITLRMLATARSPVVREVLHCTVVTSLVTFLRQWKALIFLPRSLLARDILSPRVANCKTGNPVIGNDQKKDMGLFNDSQMNSIESTCEAIRQPYPIPRICFIQGPPGTGKSHTIIGLIKKHLKNRSAELESERENKLPGSSTNNCLSQSSGRILLCAPSNAAIDVLVRRLIAETNKKNMGSTDDKNCGRINIVRIGRFSSIHPQVHPFTLDVLSKSKIAKLAANDVKKEGEVKQRLDLIRGSIDELEKQCYSLRCSGHDIGSEQVKSVNSKIDELVKKKKHIERQYGEIRARTKTRKRQEAKIKKDILFSADIICSTLSGSGSFLLHKELLTSTRKHLPFGCVIVDEACQSCELDVLIPLQFGCSKLVMVGDPEQLRTTILSQKAKDLLLGQSLYERHYRVFRERARTEEGRALHATKDNPIQMLDVQYRMHPDIAAFPSSHVYQGRLKDAKCVLQRSSICALKPYSILDVRNGTEETSSSGSLCNPVESTLVLEICLMLRKSLQEKHVGIITPYRAQVNVLEKRLRERGLEKIEVNTVDGFQGREKEIIIMSCVRAGGQTKSIGFLADRQRMNVALTRARHSLVILLHTESLVTNKDWEACINDAQKRGFLHDVTSSRDLKCAFQNEPFNAVEPDHSDKSAVKGGSPSIIEDHRQPTEDNSSKFKEIGREEKKIAFVDPRKLSAEHNRREDSNEKQQELSGKSVENSGKRENIDGQQLTAENRTCTSSVMGKVGDNSKLVLDTTTQEDLVNTAPKQDKDDDEDQSLAMVRGGERPVGGSYQGRNDHDQSSGHDDRKRKHKNLDKSESKDRDGSIVDTSGSNRGRDDSREKKRRIEMDTLSNPTDQRVSKSSRNYPKHRGYDGRQGDRNGRNEPTCHMGSKRTSNSDRDDSWSRVMGGERISHTSKNRREQDKEIDTKRRKMDKPDAAFSTTSRTMTSFDTGYQETTDLPKSGGAYATSLSGSENRKLTEQEPIISQTSEDFDFDDYSPEQDNRATVILNERSNYIEPLMNIKLGSSSHGWSHENINEDVLERVMQCGGTRLAQDDPYLSQLMHHERRERPARNADMTLVDAPSFTGRTSISGKEIPGNLVRSFSNLPHVALPEGSTSSGQQRKSVQFLLPEQTNHFQFSANSGTRRLDTVIERVKAHNPVRQPPPLLDQNDSLASFRRYHGGPRKRIAHTSDRNQHLATVYTRNIVQARIAENTNPARDRRLPNNLDKIKRSWKKRG